MVFVRRLKKKTRQKETVGLWFEEIKHRRNQTQKYDWFLVGVDSIGFWLVLLLFEKGDRKNCGTIVVAAVRKRRQKLWNHCCRCCSKKTKKKTIFRFAEPNSEISVFLSKSN